MDNEIKSCRCNESDENKKSGNSEVKDSNKREFLKKFSKIAIGTVFAGGLFKLTMDSSSKKTLWQLDPNKCIKCGRCATNCIISPSAVRCIHEFEMCGYCELCFGYFQAGARDLTTGAENQICPTDAIIRTLIEPPYYEYKIDEERCIGCGKCVKSCTDFGNGSLQLQVIQNICKNCNECSIAVKCPANAYKRVSIDKPYILKSKNL